ncbi:TGACG-sequence-specific DNA-binding protein TGA-2.1 [Capsicum galapagoense]
MGDQSNRVDASGTLAFDAEYSRWLEEQNKHINELRNAVNSHASDPELLSSVNNVTAYFDEVFKVKGNAAKADVSMSSQGCGKPLPSGVLCGMVASAPRNFLSQVMRLVGPFRPWMQGDHVMIVILMTVVDFVVNYLRYSIMMM